MKTISIMFALVNSLVASLVRAASLLAIQILRPASSLQLFLNDVTDTKGCRYDKIWKLD